MIQQKILDPITLLRHVAHVSNADYNYNNNQNKFILKGLHPRLWVKAGLVWVPGTDGRAPPAVVYGWMNFLQDNYSTGGNGEHASVRAWPIDPPVWGTEGAPLLLYEVLSTAGLVAATVATTTGNVPTIPATTRYARAKIGHVQEFQTAASRIEVGVIAQCGVGTAAVGGTWRGIASCYPAGPMSDCEWAELSSRFQYAAVPNIVDLEATEN